MIVPTFPIAVILSTIIIKVSSCLKIIIKWILLVKLLIKIKITISIILTFKFFKQSVYVNLWIQFVLELPKNLTQPIVSCTFFNIQSTKCSIAYLNKFIFFLIWMNIQIIYQFRLDES